MRSAIYKLFNMMTMFCVQKTLFELVNYIVGNDYNCTDR